VEYWNDWDQATKGAVESKKHFGEAIQKTSAILHENLLFLASMGVVFHRSLFLFLFFLFVSRHI
jgi:hypothetical protein